MPPRIVTAALILHDGLLLAARRPPADSLAGKWEFPGGKLEAGETEQACLARELHEELGVEATVGAYFGESLFTYSRGEILLRAYWVRIPSPALAPTFHDDLRWCDRPTLAGLDFAPADIPLVATLLSRPDWPA